MAYGLNSEGFTIKKFTDIKADMISALKSALGNITTSPTTVFGIITTILSNALADMWQSLQDSYFSHFPRTASGIALDYAVERGGISRKSATHSTSNVDVSIIPGTIVPAGFQAICTLNKNVFQTTDAMSWVNSLCIAGIVQVLIVGDSGTEYTIYADGAELVSYTSENGDSVETIASSIVDAFSLLISEYTMQLLTDGKILVTHTNRMQFTLTTNDADNMALIQSTITILFTAIKAGIISAPAGTLTKIGTPISGVFSVNNVADATVGVATETDDILRLRYFASKRLPGKCTIDGMRAYLLQTVTNLSQCYVYENLGAVVDPVIGNPAGSIAIITVGEVDSSVMGQAIWDCKPAGVPTWGGIASIVYDTLGVWHTVYFSKQTPRHLWMKISFTRYLEESLPNNYKEQIYDAVVNVIATMSLGKDVIISRFASPIVNIAGIRSVNITVALRYDLLTPADAEYSSGDVGTPGEIAISANELIDLIDSSSPSTYITITQE